MNQNRGRSKRRAAIVERTAEITGVTKRYVNLVMAGNRNNDHVALVFMELKEGFTETENNLVETAKKLVPFNKD